MLLKIIALPLLITTEFDISHYSDGKYFGMDGRQNAEWFSGNIFLVKLFSSVLL